MSSQTQHAAACKLRRIAAGLFAPMLTIATGAAYCQAYPVKSVRIVTGGVGGGNDILARMIAPGLATALGQQVIVDNRPTGVIPGDVVSKATPDGYTLLSASGGLWIGQFMQSVPYDPVKDFAPISLTNKAPNILVVHPSLPVRSVKDLIALAKARPGELNYASVAPGSSNHLAAELFKAMAGVSILRVPYKSDGAALTEVMGGQVQLTFATAASVKPHIVSGRLRALAVTSLQPSPLAPGLPTVSASGLPGFESGSIFGILAPAGTAAPIVLRLNHDIVRFIGSADIKEKFLNAGVETVASSPAEFAAAIKTDITRLGKIIRDVGISEK